MKDAALKQLIDQGLLVRPVEKSLHESVMPWLIEKMTGFLQDDDSIDHHVDEIV